MATEVNLPALGESVTEGTVTRWLKSVGDSVAVDEPLLEVSTDKVDTEIPSPVAGTLLEIKAQEDDTVEVGAILAVIGDEGESSGDSGGGEEQAEPEPRARARAGGPSPSRSPSPRPSRRPSRSRSRRKSLRRRRSRPRRAAAVAVRRSPCPRSASRSPRAPSPAG